MEHGSLCFSAVLSSFIAVGGLQYTMVVIIQVASLVLCFALFYLRLLQWPGSGVCVCVWGGGQNTDR